MGNAGIRSDTFTYPSILKACSQELNLDLGREVHKSIDASRLDWCLFVQNALVSMYARCGEVDDARKLFDQMPEKDVCSHMGSLILGKEIHCVAIRSNFSGLHNVQNALINMYARFQIKPVNVTMVAILSACSHSGLVTQGQMLFEKMLTVYGCEMVINITDLNLMF
ncbi:hypothetical protein RHSIM_Rhsim05G0101400 [Rhododendron simsii]|uniref:Pentatricopeptide repeat-containing protein n=1 Tax=Rhododendron simsii TaxID=118357 RepID=A0A834GZI9_RHOSS|nr:hypothetical protein RHSIM_Rhsim05G0101400 [Rhododendron simsii]